MLASCQQNGNGVLLHNEGLPFFRFKSRGAITAYCTGQTSVLRTKFHFGGGSSYLAVKQLHYVRLVPRGKLQLNIIPTFLSFRGSGLWERHSSSLWFCWCVTCACASAVYSKVPFLPPSPHMNLANIIILNVLVGVNQNQPRHLYHQCTYTHF